MRKLRSVVSEYNNTETSGFVLLLTQIDIRKNVLLFLVI